jgi:hypothetical protein
MAAAPIINRSYGNRQALKASTGGRMGARQTQPVYYDVYQNGLGVIARRGWDALTLSWLNQSTDKPVAGLFAWAQTAPQRLLQVLIDIHPMAVQARSNDITLAFAPGDTTIVAVGESAAGAGDAQISAEGTAALDALWESLDPEIGGLNGLQTAFYDMAATRGEVTVEAVPGPRGAGVGDIITFEPLSTRFRDTYDESAPFHGRLLEQNQSGRWKTLNRDLCFAVPLFGTRDNPYGRPLRAASLGELLRDLRTQHTLDDLLHAIVWPRLSVGFPFEETVQYAGEHPEVLIGAAADGGDLTPAEWAQQQFQALKDIMNNLVASDQFIMPKGAQPAVLSGAEGLRSLEGTLQMQRHRLVMALDQLPGMLGITDGGTQAYTVAQYKLMMKKLEFLRAYVNGVLLRLANLHLRLLGMPLTARADVEPMSSIDALTDQQARAAEIANELTLVSAGYLSDEDAAVNLTGSGPVRRQARLSRAQGLPSSTNQARKLAGPRPAGSPPIDPKQADPKPAGEA